MMKRFISFVVFCLFLSGCAGGREPYANRTAGSGPDNLLPMTAASMRGHKMLYDEGWYFVSSTRKALELAKEKSFRKSSNSLKMVAVDLNKRNHVLVTSMEEDTRQNLKTSGNILRGGTIISGFLLAETWDLTGKEFDFAGDQFQAAVDRFVQGNISIVRRSGEDLKKLKSLPGDYFTQLNDDFSNIWDLTATINRKVSHGIELSWEDSFDDAAKSFRSEYEQSGTRSNSLTALGDILSGYLKVFYKGVAKPGAKSVVVAGSLGTSALFLPGAAVTVISGRTVQATGLTLYYGTKAGYGVISPTVESGFMSCLALASLAATPVTLVGGAGLGAVNQVAFTAAAPTYLAGKTVTDTGMNTGRYVAQVSYDLTRRSSDVMINHATTAVVLGYNALTAIPVHTLIFMVDTVVFLGYDGPRLVVIAARGKVGKTDDNEGFSLGGLPAGTVVDLEKLRKEEGIELDVLTDDPNIIQNIVEKLPEDVGAFWRKQ